MNRIRLLAENVANQIAAGEVIERPASVVKELVENAIDAGAANVVVEVQAGGRSLVRVSDDGVGMGKDDALMSLERHATSKIQTAHDLSAISTFGFRGEALPSIASVSRFVLTTRERDSNQPEAWQVVVHGGKILEVRNAAGQHGTSVEVRQLFFNLPARRKFLRTEETENAHITHYLTLVGLAHPGLGLTYYQDQKLVWQLPPVQLASSGDSFHALRSRLKLLLGGELEMVRVDSVRELPQRFQGGLGFVEPGPEEEGGETLREAAPGKVRVWGYTGAPGVSRSSREDQHLFVNLRPVEHRGLNFAISEGYHTSLMKGRYPVCCLFLEVPPTEVDVNVHPSKKEVRFHQEQFMRRFLGDSIRSALMAYHDPAKLKSENAPAVLRPPGGVGTEPQLPASDTPELFGKKSGGGLKSEDAASPVPESTPAGDGAASVRPPAGPVLFPLGGRDGNAVAKAEPKTVETIPSNGGSPVRAPALTSNSVDADFDKPKLPQVRSVAQASADTVGGPQPLLSVPLRVVGVVGQLYVVLESNRGLVLLDQHAAHERVLFEQMLRRLETGDAPSQRLLLAETVEVSARDAVFLRGHMQVLNRLGVGLSEFGDRTFLLDALPPYVRAPDARRFVLDLVDQLKQVGEGINSIRLGEDVVAKTVCRHAVKANDPLQGRELENLVEDLRRCTMPYTCPHGRPTLIEMNYRELERKFGRTQ